MWSRCALALVVAGCTRPPAPPPVSAAPPSVFAVRDEGFGPLTAATPATLAGLHRALAGYDVVPVNREGLEYRVSRGHTRLFDIIPDHAGAILNVHVVTPEVAVGGRRVGEAFRDVDERTTCECWADQTVCFRPGTHVAVALAKVCREGAFATAAARRALAGQRIRVTIWSPRPLAPGGAGEAEHDP